MRVLLIALLAAISYAQTVNSFPYGEDGGAAMAGVPATNQYGFYDPEEMREEMYEAQQERIEDAYKYNRYAAATGAATATGAAPAATGTATQVAPVVSPAASSIPAAAYVDTGDMREDMYEAQRERVEDAYKYAAYGAQTAAAATGSTGVAPAYGYFDGDTMYPKSQSPKKLADQMEDILEDIWKRDPVLYNNIMSQLQAHPGQVNQIVSDPNNMAYINQGNMAAALAQYPNLNELVDEYPNLFTIAQNFGSIYQYAMTQPDLMKDLTKYQGRYPAWYTAGQTQYSSPFANIESEFPEYEQYYGGAANQARLLRRAHRQYGYPRRYGIRNVYNLRRHP